MEENPVPVMSCEGCGRFIWKQGNRFQCPDCGMLSTAFGGQYPNLDIEGNPCGAVAEFKAAVDAVRCHFAIKRGHNFWVKQNEDGSFSCTWLETRRKLFNLYDAKKLKYELGEEYVICDVNMEKSNAVTNE